ncbi:MAG: CBS domain-containing protein [Phycisphaerales bacterium]|nr:CBS domain-containing protein [Hyphomonadaceae bacterium]
MKIRDLMTPDVRTIHPEATIREAARMMAEADVGALPVSSGDRLAGMVTDRDIVIRGIAIGKNADSTVGEVMSHEVLYCREDDDVADVCENMSDLQVRRLPVVNADKRLVGIVSLADIADSADAEDAGEALEAITRPGGQRSQTIDGRS